MHEKDLSLNQLEKAVKLNQEILTSANLAQQNLWTMCTKLKEMRDGKLYKVLGYQNFEDYCESEVGMKRRNVYNYISIVEKINAENVQPVAQIGVKKLSLLATLSSEQQSDIAEKVDLETTTYKELKAEIDKLKKDNSELERKSRFDDSEKASLQARLDDTGNAMRSAAQKAEELKQENVRLEKENKELRSRPTDVAVIDRPIDDDNPKLKEAIRILERENMKRNEEMDRQYLQDRRELEARKQAEINALREEYEKKLAKASQPAEPMDEDKIKFKVYLTTAYSTFTQLIALASRKTEKIYTDKIKELCNNVLTNIGDKENETL